MEEKVIIDLYKTCGCAVIKFSQAQKSMQTPGIPDLLVFHKSGLWWWHEVKRLQGVRYKTVSYWQTDYQKQFQLLVEAAGHTYICGARDVAMDMLQEIGAISAQSEGGHRSSGR